MLLESLASEEGGVEMLLRWFLTLIVTLAVVAGCISSLQKVPAQPDSTKTESIEDEAARKAAAEAEEKARKEEARKRALEALSDAKKYIEEGDLVVAHSALERALVIDSDLTEARELLAEIADEAKLERAEQALEKGKADLEKEDYRSAASWLSIAVNNDATNDEAKRLLALAKWKSLSYYRGNDILLAIGSVKISGRKVVLWASVLNDSTDTHHANPNNFILIDDEGFSYTYDSDTYEYNQPFPGVNLQPGTRAGGVLVFYMQSTDSYPARLVYEPLFGQPIEVTFPTEPPPAEY